LFWIEDGNDRTQIARLKANPGTILGEGNGLVQDKYDLLRKQ
jgi:hypothetical protein